MAHAADRLRQGEFPPPHDGRARPRSVRAPPTWSPPPALAHVNRLPVLLLPGDVFANRAPDPVLQQIESFGDGTVSANDCFRPVSRYFDRITRPEQIIPALHRAMQVLTDPAECGPVTLVALPGRAGRGLRLSRELLRRAGLDAAPPAPDERRARGRGRRAQGREEAGHHRRRRRALFARRPKTLTAFAEKHGIPVVETQAGKSSLPHDHPLNMGSVGVTGTSAANLLAEEADVILAVGTRLQDFTTGSWALFKSRRRQRSSGSTSQPFDAGKHRALPLVADAMAGLEASRRGARRLDRRPASGRQDAPRTRKADWLKAGQGVTAPTNAALPSDAQVIGAVQRARRHEGDAGLRLRRPAGRTAQALAGRRARQLPSRIRLLAAWATRSPAASASRWRGPTQDVVVMVGDGSYLMMNSEIATSVMLGLKLTIVVLDNRGFGCINRLQMATGGANFNNLLEGRAHEVLPRIDFAAHAATPGRDRAQGRLDRRAGSGA